MFSSPIGPSKGVHLTPPVTEQTQALQGILDTAFADVPKGTPVGCNLAILQNADRPLQMPIVLHSSGIPLDAAQHWGSVSKQFTAACIAKLVALGKLDWKDDAGKLLGLPSFKLGDEKDKTVTIDQLLHMRSGLPEMTTLAALVGKDDLLMSLEEKLTLLSMYPYLEFEPGSQESYCNTNYYLLAAVVEKASGKSFADFVRDEVFLPLNMGCKCSVDPDCPSSIDGYTRDYNLEPLKCQTVGATGIVGRPHEMAHWNAALGSGEWKDLLELPPDAALQEKQPVYARGLNVTRVGDYKVIHHSGSVGCFVTQFMRYEHLHDPGKTFAFFLTSNVDNIPLSDKMAQDIAVVLAQSEGIRFALPAPPEPPMPIPIDHKDVIPFVGTYKSHDLHVEYEITSQREKGTWVLHLSHKNEQRAREIAAFVPTAPGVFSGPIGDTLKLTKKGAVLTGAKIAPLNLTRIYEI